MTTGEVVDLSVILSPELPCAWPNAVPFRQFVDHWFEDVADDVQPLHCFNDAPYRSHGWIIDEHTGTHFDAPSHFLQSGPPGAAFHGEDVPLSQFIGPAAVIDVRPLAEAATSNGVSPRIEPADISEWERTNGPLTAGDVALFLTGWDRHYVRKEQGGGRYLTDVITHHSAPGWPAPSAATMELLAERGVRCVGTDGASMGPADDGAPTHIAGLTAGLVFIECLTQLHRLPARGAHFTFLPVKVARSSGGPGRAIAIL